jgi:hypothetical protein
MTLAKKENLKHSKLVITWCDAFDNFLTDQYKHILIWDVDVRLAKKYSQ